jgi:hypothetical protein
VLAPTAIGPVPLSGPLNRSVPLPPKDTALPCTSIGRLNTALAGEEIDPVNTMPLPPSE